jgi:hypothetical protein
VALATLAVSRQVEAHALGAGHLGGVDPADRPRGLGAALLTRQAPALSGCVSHQDRLDRTELRGALDLVSGCVAHCLLNHPDAARVCVATSSPLCEWVADGDPEVADIVVRR